MIGCGTRTVEPTIDSGPSTDADPIVMVPTWRLEFAQFEADVRAAVLEAAGR